MTNEKAIDLLNNLIGFVEDNQGNDYDEAFKLAIKALGKSWIPVTERPPEDKGAYLVTIKNVLDGKRFVSIAIKDALGWMNGENVIAWMHRPEPYKEEK